MNWTMILVLLIGALLALGVISVLAPPPPVGDTLALQQSQSVIQVGLVAVNHGNLVQAASNGGAAEVAYTPPPPKGEDGGWLWVILGVVIVAAIAAACGWAAAPKPY